MSTVVDIKAVGIKGYNQYSLYLDTHVRSPGNSHGSAWLLSQLDEADLSENNQKDYFSVLLHGMNI